MHAHWALHGARVFVSHESHASWTRGLSTLKNLQACRIAANAPAVLVLADNSRASSLLLVVGSCALWEESPGLYV